jgi:hypothetical protein
LSKLTKNPWQVFILDTGSTKRDFAELTKTAGNYNNVQIELSNQKLKGSLAHGTGLNALVKKVDTEYFSILDADAMWLLKDWDEVLISKLSDTCKVVGTQAMKGGPKPEDFPLMFAILFETKTFQKLNVDFRPKDLSQYQDTGWELREKYLRAGYKACLLESKSTRWYQDGPFRNVICEEYYLSEYPHIVVSHFGRGSSLGAVKYRNTILFDLPVIGRIAKLMKGISEKQRWLNICKAIIDAQL